MSRVSVKKLARLILFFGVALLLGGCAHIEATVRGHSPSEPVQVKPGEAVSLSVTVANTGNRARSFIVRASVWRKGGPLEKRYETVLEPPLKPGEERTISWTHTAGQEGEYSIQFSVWKDEDTPLAQAPQTAQPLIVVVGAPEPVPGKFSLGERVRVMQNLNVREGPGLEQPEVTDPEYPGYLPEGSLGNILEGPVEADGYRWWKVDFDRGVTGWCVEDGIESLDVLLGRKDRSGE
ncbi:TPA: hypothetical protein DCL37_03465 [Candidatus Acetothermia bacterium]|nr:hypothetical protein [Candidatus Acetothermia bacterium]